MGADRLVGVVIASRGYPEKAETGTRIEGLERAAAVPDAYVFHAGTRASAGGIVTAGGRVVTVVGRGRTYESAMATAYRAVEAISFDGMQYRHDIGRKAMQATGDGPRPADLGRSL
jgi:phosphoribosylamine---glycine ligase